jgi:2-dehydro-3-deoxyglucarate aldolase/4-hydroxy-2-oxoheptanedioate aldolase
MGGDIGQKISDYHARTVVMAQIETERGLDNVEAIAAVDGIDVLWVGHFDLSNFMGMPAQFDNPVFVAAMQRVADVAKKHNKIAGFMATVSSGILSPTIMILFLVAHPPHISPASILPIQARCRTQRPQ